MRLEQTGGTAEQHVAGLMAQVVVDQLQAVHIGHDRIQGPSLPYRSLQYPFQVVAAGDPCQRIRLHLPFKGIAFLLQGCDIRMHAHHPQGPSLTVAAGHATASQYPQPGAVGMAHPVGANKSITRIR